MASGFLISTPSATLTFSDIDSDAAAAILHRTVRRRSTTNRATQPPTPGTRRFRRYLNALLSADEGGSSSDYYSATSDGEGREDGEPEVWRSEWRGEFVRAGDDFFEGRVGVARSGGKAGGEEEKGSRLQRRVKTIEKERLERRRQRRERHERKQRRLTAVDQLTTSSSNTSSPALTSMDDAGSLAMLRAQKGGGVREVVQDDFVMVDAEVEDGKAEDEEEADGQQQQEQDGELMMTNVIAGNALTHDLWRCIDKPTRHLLRHMDDFTYLHHLEHLLLAFKAHNRTHPTTPFIPPQLPASAARFFTVLGGAGGASGSLVRPAGELVLVVDDGLLRCLLYGALGWHVMYAASGRGGGTGGGVGGRGRGGGDSGVVCVRMQRGWVYHECRLERFIQQHYAGVH